MKADQIWSHTEGASTIHRIYVIDTGMDNGDSDPHEDLDDPQGCFNFANDTAECDDTEDHGTGVTGVAIALDNSTDLVGVAPAADHFQFKVIGGGVDALVAGIDSAFGPLHVGDILQISIATCEHDADLASAVSSAYSSNMLLVVAAGNTNTCPGLDDDEVTWPARYADAIAVSGVDSLNNFAEPGIELPDTQDECAGSVYGNEVELTAPFLVETLGLNDGVRWHCGTSFAAPAVSGTAALIWSVAPNWTNAQVRSRLQSTATDVESSGWDNKTGYGLVNACKAAGKCPGLTASISGLDEIPPFTSCTYNASVYGGIPGYTYQWSGLGSGTGSSVTVNTMNSGWLYLTVKDAGTPQQTKNVQKYITVVQAPPMC